MEGSFSVSKQTALILVIVLVILACLATVAARKHMAEMKKLCQPPLGQLMVQ